MLPLDTLIALAVFAFVTSITPGPNNLMLMASGVNFGLARTVPHMLGVGIGFVAMVVLVGLGFGQLLAAAPWLLSVIKIAGVAYMLWLAWHLATAGGVEAKAGKGRPMTFIEAAAFQWVNPKGWAMAVTAIATYTLADQFIASVIVVGVVFGIVNIPSVATWALFGVWMQRFLSDERKIRIFNVTMALLLVASLWPAVAELLRL